MQRAFACEALSAMHSAVHEAGAAQTRAAVQGPPRRTGGVPPPRSEAQQRGGDAAQPLRGVLPHTLPLSTDR